VNPSPEEKNGFVCAVIQLCSAEDLRTNLDIAKDLVHQAADDGAQCVTLPENFAWLALSSQTVHPAMTLDGPVVAEMCSVAKERGLHMLLGSISEAGPDPERTYNTSVWINPQGEVVTTYRKIHLFDIDIPGSESHQESARIAPGDRAVCVKTELANFGLSICYDLRFPELYRELVNQGAEVICVPAAFTLTTGKDHWHPLLRARAIESQAYVVAPGQWGHHGGKRRSYGHSMIIDPWGTVIAEVPDGVGYAVARINLKRVEKTRLHLPALDHQRPDIWKKEGTP